MSEKQEAGEEKHLPCSKIVPGQEQLTPEQEAYACQFAQERIAAMLSTAPVDESEAEEHLHNAYKVAGLESPRVRWFDSPLAFVLAHFSRSLWDTVRDSVRDTTRDLIMEDSDSVEDPAWSGLRDFVETSVVWDWNTVNASVWDSVWDKDHNWLWDESPSGSDTFAWDSTPTFLWKSAAVNTT